MDDPRSFLRWSLPAVALIAFALPAAVASAAEPSPDLLAKITKLNKKAVEAYQQQDYDTAKDLLRQALDACNANHLEHHPITARTEVHIGVLLIGGLKQRAAGVKHFTKALQIQPDIQLTKSLVTPELQDAFEEAVLGAGGEEGGGAKRSGGGDEEGGASEGAGAEGGDEDHPRRKMTAPPKRKPAKKARGDEDEGGDEKKDDDEVDDEDASTSKFFIGLSVGTGFGTAGGTGETTTGPNLMTQHKLGGAGFALAQLGHVSLEGGYFMSQKLLLSLQLRLQYDPNVNPPPGSTEPSTAIAGFLRATYLLAAHGFRPYVSVAVGGGAIHHAVVFKTPPVCGPNHNATCVETFSGGPVLVGPGAGFLVDLGSTFALNVALNTQLGLPNFTFNVDVQAGLALRF